MCAKSSADNARFVLGILVALSRLFGFLVVLSWLFGALRFCDFCRDFLSRLDSSNFVTVLAWFFFILWRPLCVRAFLFLDLAFLDSAF